MINSPGPEFDMTRLLHSWQSGDKQAESELFESLQRNLKDMCRWRLSQVISPQLTLRSTELFNELYLRLDAQTKSIDWANRAHFFYIAGRIIRQIVADEVRRKRRRKRDAHCVTFEDSHEFTGEMIHLDDLDVALSALEKQSPDQARMVELRFYIGLSYPEIATVLGITEAQAKHRWNKAKSWLAFFLKKQ